MKIHVTVFGQPLQVMDRLCYGTIILYVCLSLCM